MTRAVTSTVVATGPALLAGALAIVPLAVLAVLLDTGMVWAVSALALVVVLMTSVHLGTVRVSAGADGLWLGNGLRGRARRIDREQIVALRVVTLSRADVYGVGRRPRWSSTRVVAGPGSALEIDLHSGDRVLVGTPLADRIVDWWTQAGDPAGQEVR